MVDVGATLWPIRFRFAYTGHGWARATISDGVAAYEMSPSYVPQDPLWVLIATLDRVLAYGGEAHCVCNFEPLADRWILERDSDALQVVIGDGGFGYLPPGWRPDPDNVCFSTTCDVWKFAAQVRTAASRLQPVEEDYHDPTGVQRSPEYRALCAYLDERKRALRTSSANEKRPRDESPQPVMR
jgi:hypothetical protein